MAKLFGLYNKSGNEPLQTISGDYVKEKGDLVMVMKKSRYDKTDKAVGSFKPAAGQTVREVG